MKAKHAQRPKPKPARIETGVSLPAVVWRHSHGAIARLDAMEESARLAIAGGRLGFRIVKSPAPPRPAIDIATDMRGVLLGPDGKALDLR